ncbi:hypothetical protein EXIGLDRAFT_523598 [Exidia glandulosa HHB12029]|uniref:Uncharacterized protein n=1 Tax=Exidia glandulosa HHB12029 TaxID=1314781 RepID=A0A166MZ14_EXIGL|nr:hypothetical protein EXIGLDRAFT_523598 [Exidia glandulosa HHB12029]
MLRAWVEPAPRRELDTLVRACIPRRDILRAIQCEERDSAAALDCHARSFEENAASTARPKEVKMDDTPWNVSSAKSGCTRNKPSPSGTDMQLSIGFSCRSPFTAHAGDDPGTVSACTRAAAASRAITARPDMVVVARQERCAKTGSRGVELDVWPATSRR